MLSRKLSYFLALVALTMLSIAGCSGGGGSNNAVSKDGYKVSVSGSVAEGKSLLKTLFATGPNLGTLTVINAQDGTTLGTGAIDSAGAFSNISLTLPTAKAILVFKADVSLAGSPFRTIVPIDLSTPPAAGISASNSININISQATTDIAKTVSAMLGLTGMLGDAGQTLDSKGKTYADAAQLVVANGGQVLAYNTSGLALTGSLTSGALLPATDATTLSFDDLKNISLDGKIISAFIPGKNPIVNFQVVNKATGKGISGMRIFSLHLAQLQPEANGSNSYWMNYIANGLPLTAIPAFTERGATIQTAPVNPSTDAVTVYNADGSVKVSGYTVIDHGDGTYTATFGADITANTLVPYIGNENLTHRIAIGARTVSTPGVVGKTPGAYAGPVNPIAGGNLAAFPNTNGTAFVYDFVPATGAMLADANGKQIFARDIVNIAACNQCHYKIEHGSNNTSGHFGSRPDTKVCVVCHTPQIDSGAGNFTNFIHQIHMGEELPVPASPVGISVSEFKYPQDIRNCTMCHKGADVDNWNSKPSRKACGSCHNNIDFATGANATVGGTAHSVQTGDTLCAGCHAGLGVKTNHQTNDITANNPTIPTGLVTFTYAVSSATINASNQPVINFTIKKDGTNVTLDATPSTRRLPLGLQGFKGGPTIGVYFGVTQDNITAPADFNASVTASLVNLWNSVGGTLVQNADGSFTATITSGTVPATAKIITASVYGNFSQAVPFKAYSTGKEIDPAVTRNALQAVKLVTATGNTARRAIVSTALCNKCHEQLGIKPSFHGGARNDATVCAFCHTPNRAGTGWAGGSSNFVHAIHAASKRSTQFTWHADLQYWTVGYPGILKNCEQCHLAGTYDFSATNSAAAVANLLPITVATGTPTASTSLSPYVTAGTVYGSGFSYTAATGVSVEAAATTLINSPISSACFSCHDTKAAKAHMLLNGGSIYEARSTALGKTETCLVCHGGVSSTNAFNATAPNIKTVHRWW